MARPYQGFAYSVRVPDLQFDAGFSKVSGLNEESDVAEYREGEDPPTMTKMPGLVKFGNVTLERGIDQNQLLRTWRRQVTAARSFYGISLYHHETLITLRDVKGGAQPGANASVPLLSWSLIRSWPAVYNIADLDANSSDPLLVTVELAHEGIEEIPIVL